MEEAALDDYNSYIGTEAITQEETKTSYESEDNVITTTQEQQPQQSLQPMSVFRVPPELQIPLIVLIALIGFLAILGLSSVSVPKTKTKVARSKKDDDDNDDNDDDDDNTDTTGTPKRKSTRSSSEVTGSIVTPAGRRSARLRAKHT